MVEYVWRVSPGCHTWAEYKNCIYDYVTHIGGFLVVINMVDVSGQAKVCDLHYVVISHKNITCCQVSMDALKHTHTCIMTWERRFELVKLDLTELIGFIPFWMPNTPCHVPPGRRRTPSLWWTLSQQVPGLGCSSIPYQEDDGPSGIHASSLWRHTPQWRKEDLKE